MSSINITLKQAKRNPPKRYCSKCGEKIKFYVEVYNNRNELSWFRPKTMNEYTGEPDYVWVGTCPKYTRGFWGGNGHTDIFIPLNFKYDPEPIYAEYM